MPDRARFEVDAARVIADLRELARRTSDERGAQRVCWTASWRRARGYLGELLAELGIAPEIDEAGNLWAELPGSDPDAAALVCGSHIDSVPDGGWLDGALGLMTALGVLRAAAAAKPAPAAIRLVDWADEEGARFGRSLYGSSCFSGSLDPADIAELRDADGLVLAEVLGENWVDLEAAAGATRRQQRVGAYLELHIEQGPRMAAGAIGVAAVDGCVGIDRRRFTFSGQAGHAGTTPMATRRDAGLAAAEAALGIERVPGEVGGGMATTGELRLEPGISTAVPGRATLSVDLRHGEAGTLERMLEATRSICAEVAAARECSLAEEPIWSIEPTVFDPALVAAAEAACRATTGSASTLTSGALHDAAEVARVVPAAMLFCPSIGGISHAAIEDTGEDDLTTAIETYGAWAAAVLARLGE